MLGFGDGAVEQTLGCGEVRAPGADIAGIVDEVATHSESGSVGFCFLWPYVTHESGICDSPTRWDLAMVDEEDSVGACDAVSNALCQSSKLVGRGV